MPSIRHIAIKCEDPASMAEFYCATFDMHEVARSGRTVYLSDGYINLALLSTREGEKPGINHFGFQVEDVAEIKRRLGLAEVPEAEAKPSDGRYAELGATDPEGNRFDISEAGWYTEEGAGLVPVEKRRQV